MFGEKSEPCVLFSSIFNPSPWQTNKRPDHSSYTQYDITCVSTVSMLKWCDQQSQAKPFEETTEMFDYGACPPLFSWTPWCTCDTVLLIGTTSFTDNMAILCKFAFEWLLNQVCFECRCGMCTHCGDFTLIGKYESFFFFFFQTHRALSYVCGICTAFATKHVNGKVYETNRKQNFCHSFSISLYKGLNN